MNDFEDPVEDCTMRACDGPCHDGINLDGMVDAAWNAVQLSGWDEATKPAAVAVAVEGVVEYLRIHGYTVAVAS